MKLDKVEHVTRVSGLGEPYYAFLMFCITPYDDDTRKHIISMITGTFFLIIYHIAWHI